MSQGSNVQGPALSRSTLDPSGCDYVSGLGTPHVGHLIADLTAPPTNVAEVPSGPGLLVLGGELIAARSWRKARRRRGGGGATRGRSG